jgi:hypothetical protein
MAMAAAGACAGVITLGASAGRTTGATRVALPSAFVSSGWHFNRLNVWHEAAFEFMGFVLREGCC